MARTIVPKKEIKKEIKEPEVINLFNADKIKNLELIMVKLKTNPKEISNALLTMNKEILNINNVEYLLRIMPNDQEIQAIKNFKGDEEKLGVGEKFIKEIIKVNGFSTRLQALKFLYTHEENLNELTDKLNKFFEIVEDLPKNKKIYDIFINILAIGNFLNGTSNKGGAFGFKLDDLDKVDSIKSLDMKKSLLMFVIENMEKNDTKLEFNEEIIRYDFAVKNSIDSLKIELNDFMYEANFIHKALQKQTDISEDKVTECFKSFSDELIIIENSLKKKLKNSEEFFQKCLDYFCEKKEMTSDKFFEKLLNFFKNCKKAKENNLMLELREKARIRALERTENKQITNVNNESQNLQNHIRVKAKRRESKKSYLITFFFSFFINFLKVLWL